MHIGLNIKKIREEKGLMQKEVAAVAGMHPANYNKVGKGERDPSIDALDNIAKYFGLTVDQLIHYEGNIPKEITIEDKTTYEKLRMIEQLEEPDKQALFRMIDCMLIKNKFKDFFQKNVAHYNRKAGLLRLFCLYYCANIQSWFLYIPANKSKPKLTT